jgi:hypothetical protein
MDRTLRRSLAGYTRRLCTVALVAVVLVLTRLLPARDNVWRHAGSVRRVSDRVNSRRSLIRKRLTLMFGDQVLPAGYGKDHISARL